MSFPQLMRLHMIYSLAYKVGVTQVVVLSASRLLLVLSSLLVHTYVRMTSFAARYIFSPQTFCKIKIMAIL